jgi:hypothetical protein
LLLLSSLIYPVCRSKYLKVYAGYLAEAMFRERE